jgi:hypothetical protein
MKRIPEWLELWFQSALLGEVYPEIRAIAVEFTEKRKLTVRYYLEREPTEGDWESLSMVMTSILSNTSSNEEIKEVVEECIYSDLLLGEIDTLDCLVYARREYCLEEIQSEPVDAANASNAAGVNLNQSARIR